MMIAKRWHCLAVIIGIPIAALDVTIVSVMFLIGGAAALIMDRLSTLADLR